MQNSEWNSHSSSTPEDKKEQYDFYGWSYKWPSDAIQILSHLNPAAHCPVHIDPMIFWQFTKTRTLENGGQSNPWVLCVQSIPISEISKQD